VRLTPDTTPEQIVEAQLDALRRDDMSAAFAYASPNNKDRVQNSLPVFDKMVRSGLYRFLVRHRKSELLLTTTLRGTASSDGDDKNTRWQGLVRVLADDASFEDDSNDDSQRQQQQQLGELQRQPPLQEQQQQGRQNQNPQQRPHVVEYWWSLSRCQRDDSEYKDCYMVDAVIPNM